MTPEEQNLITGLFNRLRAAEASAPAKDKEAEALIGQLTAQVPTAPYLLTQTLLVQEHALMNAQARIQALERQTAQAQSPASSGGFLSGLFGAGTHAVPPPVPAAAHQPPPAPPYPSTIGMAPSAGSGFLRNALTTAAGVAGGAMLFQGIENLLGYHSGPFGGVGGFGGGGFLGGGAPPQIVENNYYNDGSSQGAGGQDAPFNDAGFNTDNPFAGTGAGDPLLDAPDPGAMDNTYDAENTDANAGGDFTSTDDSSSGGGNDFSSDGGGDFGGGDSSS